MSRTNTSRGVLQAESERRAKWADLGLPDPLTVLAEERAMRVKTGHPHRSRHRSELDAYFATHPDISPPDGWTS